MGCQCLGPPRLKKMVYVKILEDIHQQAPSLEFHTNSLDMYGSMEAKVSKSLRKLCEHLQTHRLFIGASLKYNHTLLVQLKALENKYMGLIAADRIISLEFGGREHILVDEIQMQENKKTKMLNTHNEYSAANHLELYLATIEYFLKYQPKMYKRVLISIIELGIHKQGNHNQCFVLSRLDCLRSIFSIIFLKIETKVYTQISCEAYIRLLEYEQKMQYRADHFSALLALWVANPKMEYRALVQAMVQKSIYSKLVEDIIFAFYRVHSYNPTIVTEIDGIIKPILTKYEANSVFYRNLFLKLLSELQNVQPVENKPKYAPLKSGQSRKLSWEREPQDSKKVFTSELDSSLASIRKVSKESLNLNFNMQSNNLGRAERERNILGLLRLLIEGKQLDINETISYQCGYLLQSYLSLQGTTQIQAQLRFILGTINSKSRDIMFSIMVDQLDNQFLQEDIRSLLLSLLIHLNTKFSINTRPQNIIPLRQSYNHQNLMLLLRYNALLIPSSCSSQFNIIAQFMLSVTDCISVSDDFLTKECSGKASRYQERLQLTQQFLAIINKIHKIKPQAIVCYLQILVERLNTQLQSHNMLKYIIQYIKFLFKIANQYAQFSKQVQKSIKSINALNGINIKQIVIELKKKYSIEVEANDYSYMLSVFSRASLDRNQLPIKIRQDSCRNSDFAQEGSFRDSNDTQLEEKNFKEVLKTLKAN